MFAHFVNFSAHLQSKLLLDFEIIPFYERSASFEDISLRCMQSLMKTENIIHRSICFYMPYVQQENCAFLQFEDCNFYDIAIQINVLCKIHKTIIGCRIE